MAGGKKSKGINGYQHSKRRTVELDDGWSVVTRKAISQGHKRLSKSQNAACLAQSKPKNALSTSDGISSGDDVDSEASEEQKKVNASNDKESLEKIQAKYQIYKAKWTGYDYHMRVRSALKTAFSNSSPGTIVDSSICVAIGCFNEDEESSWSNRSIWQLILFLEVCSWLAHRFAPSTPGRKFKVHIQEPRFKKVDITFLSELELDFHGEVFPTSAKDAVGKHVGTHTFLFNAFLEWSILIGEILPSEAFQIQRGGDGVARKGLAKRCPIYLGPNMEKIRDHVEGLRGQAWISQVEGDTVEERDASLEVRTAMLYWMQEVVGDFAYGSSWIALPKSFEGHTEALMDLGLHFWTDRRPLDLTSRSEGTDE